jgi:hypothetical protein
MTDRANGHFYVGELTDGRFVAAASSAPYFCFRAASEEAVIEKVRRALAFYRQINGDARKVKIKSVSHTVTTVQPTKRVALNEVICEAA